MRHFFSGRTGILGTALCLAVLSSLPAAAAADRPGEGLRFHHYTQADGLAQNTVEAIVQDRRGFIWLGTDDGLHRFDGYEMAVYQARPDVPDGLQSDTVLALAVDGKGGLWIGTYGGGVSRLDIGTDTITHFRHADNDPESLRSDFVYWLAINPDGTVWVLSDKGLDLLDPVSGKAARFPLGETTGLATADIWSIFVDSQGVTWAATGNGLFLRDSGGERFRLFRADDPRFAAFHDQDILALGETPAGELLVSTRSGLYRLDARREVTRHFAPEAFGLPAGSDVALGRVLATSTGEIWVSSFGSGVYWWDGMSERFRHYRHDPSDQWSLSDDVVFAMLEDRTGVVWLGTETGGANTFNPATRAFRHFRYRKDDPNSLPNRVIWSIIEDGGGDLWIASDGGLSRLDRERGKYTHYLHDPENTNSLSSPFVYDVLEDARGRIWAATLDGINLLDASSGTFRHYRFTAGVDNTAYANSVSFLLEREGSIWAGTASGLFRLDPESGEYQSFLREGAGDSLNFFTAATPARAGGWWLGSESGVVRFDPATGKFMESYTAGPDGTLSHPFVIDVLETADGTLWVATDYQLNRIGPDGSVKHIGVKQGLPNNTIYSLLEDEDGDLWIGTNKGLAEYDPVSGEVHVYYASDGLQANEFNAAAKFRSPSGEMFFGGINGFTAFHPSEIAYNAEPPAVAITKFFKFNRPVPMDRPIHALDTLKLSWRDSVIGFEFAAFDFAAPSKNRFRYRLEGFDRQWLEAAGHNHVTYTNLDPGRYLLRVQGANRHGVWSENEARLAIEIAPPPWQAWWAYALYVLAALGVLVMALRFHFVRLAERHQLETAQQKRQWAETLQQLTQALASSLDGRQVAEELLENLRTMVAFRKAVLFVEQGVEIHVAGAKGVRDEHIKDLESMPLEYSRFFAEVRHARKARIVMRHDLQVPVLQDDMSPAAQFLAVPAYSRADEFALLLIGRDTPPFSEQERDIVSAFLTQAMVAIDNARLFAEVQNLATTDPLTQVSNRRYFFELAELEFARSKRYGRDVSLILLDADNFKTINDVYGREIGDRVLKIIANCCRNSLRHFDIIGRYGGEDFIVMLPETAMNVAADVADRLRRSIEGIHIDTHKGELGVTVSVGVAVATGNTPDLPALINRADMALYEAKRAGRNKVVVAEK